MPKVRRTGQCIPCSLADSAQPPNCNTSEETSWNIMESFFQPFSQDSQGPQGFLGKPHGQPHGSFDGAASTSSGMKLLWPATGRRGRVRISTMVKEST